MNADLIKIASKPLTLSNRPRLLLAEITGREHKALTELIARLALRGPFHVIAGDAWLPDQDSLGRAVHRHTNRVREALDHPIIGRPANCIQMPDQLASAGLLNRPILALNFLHYFYDPDVDLSLRERVLGESIRSLRALSESRPVIVLVQHLPTEEYERFFEMLADVADEVLEAVETPAAQISQSSLFEGA